MTESTDGAFCLRAAAEDGIAPVLKGVRAQARLDGLLFGLTLRQTYRNTSRRTLEVVYTFPLPASAVLLGFAAEFDNHRVECQVLPRQQAEEVYETALEAGDAPALLEAGPDGLHTANLGNLKPGEQVVLEIRFAQLVAFEQGRLRLAIPTTIAPRYGLPERSGLHAHQVPEAALEADYPLEFSVLVAGALASAAVECPTHEVQASVESEGLRLELAPGARLDRDVVLLITPPAEEPSQPTSVLAWSQGVGVAAFQLPVLEQEASPLALKLLVDGSGSMGGDSIASARRALQAVAAGLREADEVSLTRFGSEVAPVLAPSRCTPATLGALSHAIAGTDADLGGTEMEKALLATFALPSYLGAENDLGCGRADVLLITDGEVWDTRRMIERARRGGHRVFVIGVGASPAEAVLRHLAEATGGACEFATPGEQLEAAAARMLRRMRQRVWTGLRVQWEGCGSPAWELPLPTAAFGGDTLLALAGFEDRGQQPGDTDLLGDPIAPPRPAGVRLLARATAGAADGTEQVLASIDAVTEAPGDDLPRIAAARRIAAWAAADALAAQSSSRADVQPANLADLEDSTQDKARELAVHHRLVTEHTHAVLVHERAEADKPTDDSVLHRVKSMLAAGWGATGSVNASVRNPVASMSLTSSLNVPSVWRSARSRPDPALTSGHDLGEIEIPAFLRRQGTGIDAAEAAMIAFGPTSPNLEDLVVHIVGHLESGGLIEELPDLVRRLMPEEATCQPVQVVQAVQALQVAMALIGDEGTCWMLLALWVVQRSAVEGLGNFEAPLLASMSRTSVTPDAIGRVWTVFDRELGQAVVSAIAAPAPDQGTPAGICTDSSQAAFSRRQQRLSAALSGSGG